jgi:hypothetical protein
MGVSVFSNLAATNIMVSASETICDGESYAFGTQTLTTGGMYTEVFMSAEGCDSTVNLTLSVNSVNIMVTQTGAMLSADASGANYQWIDCGNGNAIIPGETSQSFTPSVNGNYAVIVTENSCSDTSACYNVSNVGINDQSFANPIRVYPNPVQDVLAIDLGENDPEVVSIKLLNLQGQAVYQNLSSGQTEIMIEIEGLAAGMYILQIRTDKASFVSRIVKN